MAIELRIAPEETGLTTDRLAYYETTFCDLRERLVRVLGAPTVDRLILRAVAEIERAHPGIGSIRCEDDQVVFDQARIAFAEATDEQIRDAFAALTGVMLLILARLLGRQVAERLTEGLAAAAPAFAGGAR